MQKTKISPQIGGTNMENWKPKEIIINEKVKDDPVTKYVLDVCGDVPTRYVADGRPNTIVDASETLKGKQSMLDKILAGKQVLYIGPPGNDTVDLFTMPDDRMVCPHFDRLKLASNGCFYQCDWCYLKLTYRAAYPFISIKADYEKIKRQLSRKLNKSNTPVIFNSGELADSLALDHLTRAGREFIPWFGRSGNGFLYMLTKSDNVGDILDLDHNGHTVIAWSMNNASVSRKFEIGAPIFQRRLAAARKVQGAGYPLRIRLDPIVPFDGWRRAYAETIKELFSEVSPERVTLGTLRFEKGFYNMRNSLFTTGPELPRMMEDMEPMFPPKMFPGSKRPKVGKYSFSEMKRTEIFRFAIEEIRKYSDCRIALCKESENVWQQVGLDVSRCSCVCQLDYAEIPVSTHGE
jgi:spore photoproduct lyase